MNIKQFKSKTSFKDPAVYKIVVEGKLDVKWSENLAGMQITLERSEEGETSSILVGRISDQAALSGILNLLYENHIMIRSVNMLDENV